MTTLIFVENVLGSGQVVKLTEDYGDYSISRDLRPGENARLVVSPFKNISVEEVAVAASEVVIDGADEGRSFCPAVRKERRFS